MSIDVTKIIGGPAKVTYGGATIYSKADIVEELSIETFGIETDRFQKVDDRVSGTPVRIRLTPIGILTDMIPLFQLYAGLPLGDLITPVRTLGNIDETANTITIEGHKLRAGMAVLISTSAADFPGGLDGTTLYYVGVIDEDTISLHTTYANAIALTSAVDITDDGTGTHKLIQQEPLVIHTVHGKKITYHNAAVVQLPQLTPGATKTLLGEIIFEAFLRNDKDQEDANSIFTEEDAAYTDDEFDPADIITQCYQAAWGAPPFDDFATKAGWAIDFALTLEPVETDCQGVLTRRLVGLAVTGKAIPLGISEAELRARLMIQGGGASRGRSLSGDNLNISGTNVYIRLYAAALVGGPMNYGSRSDRMGELEWRANRSFTSGVPNPLFYIGEAAPA